MQFVERQEDLKKPVGGLIIVEQNENDHIMGATSPINTVLKEDGQWDDFLPVVEIQRTLDGQDTYCCVSFSHNNCLEIVHKKKYNQEINMDDRFTGVGSGTKKGLGNSVQAPAEFARTKGFIPQGKESVDMTLDEFFVPLTPEEFAEGAKSLQSYELKYAWLPRPLGSASCKPETLVNNLKYGPVQASVDGSAYQFNAEGYIGQIGDLNYSHEIVVFGYELGKYWKIFDSETNQLLKFAWDYPFGFPMCHNITKLSMMYKKKGQSAIGLVNELKTGLWLWTDGEDALGQVIGGSFFKAMGLTYSEAQECDEWPLPIVGYASIRTNL